MDQVALILFGGLLTILGGIVGSVILGRIENTRETTRQIAAHKAAVRACVYELSADLVVVQHATSTLDPGVVSTTAHDSLLLPLYGRLPDKVAMTVSLAYQTMRAVGKVGALGLKPALPNMLEAQDDLRRYAEQCLKMDFKGL